MGARDLRYKREENLQKHVVEIFIIFYLQELNNNFFVVIFVEQIGVTFFVVVFFSSWYWLPFDWEQQQQKKVST